MRCKKIDSFLSNFKIYFGVCNLHIKKWKNISQRILNGKKNYKHFIVLKFKYVIYPWKIRKKSSPSIFTTFWAFPVRPLTRALMGNQLGCLILLLTTVFIYSVLDKDYNLGQSSTTHVLRDLSILGIKPFFTSHFWQMLLPSEISQEWTPRPLLNLETWSDQQLWSNKKKHDAALFY